MSPAVATFFCCDGEEQNGRFLEAGIHQKAAGPARLHRGEDRLLPCHLMLELVIGAYPCGRQGQAQGAAPTPIPELFC